MAQNPAPSLFRSENATISRIAIHAYANLVASLPIGQEVDSVFRYLRRAEQCPILGAKPRPSAPCFPRDKTALSLQRLWSNGHPSPGTKLQVWFPRAQWQASEHRYLDFGNVAPSHPPMFSEQKRYTRTAKSHTIFSGDLCDIFIVVVMAQHALVASNWIWKCPNPETGCPPQWSAFYCSPSRLFFSA